MKHDTMYRAFKGFKEELTNDKTIARNHSSLDDASSVLMSSTKFEIEIDAKWILEIESKLEYVSKAIKEERQFIRTNGEVVPIEKVKKISKDSVSHLAKHSNFITHVPENETDDVIPDKIYMVEKLSDFAVYENRFLYMLLCYLRDFLDIRLTKINKLLDTIKMKMELNTNIDSKKHLYNLNLHLDETRYDNDNYLISEESKVLFKKIKDLAQIVNSLLDTPLMVEVSKTPMIKPPVTKTNVLKMNNNFKNALALYDYISEFNEDGFTSKEVTNNLNEIKSEASSDAVRIDEIASFLTLEYTEDLAPKLKESYEKYKEEQIIKENEKAISNLEVLKKRLSVEEITPYDYILRLEELNKNLTLEHQMLVDTQVELLNKTKENEELKNKNEVLKQEVLGLNLSLEKKKDELEALHKKYIEDMAAQKAYYEGEIKRINEEHENEMASLKQAHQEEISSLKAEYEEKISNLVSTHESEMAFIKEEYQSKIDKLEAGINDKVEETISSYEERLRELETSHTIELDNLNLSHQNEINDLTSKLDDVTSQIDSYKDERDNALLKCEADIKASTELCDDKIAKNNEKTEFELNMMREELNLANARVLAIEAKYKEKTIDDDFTSKEDFEALELQYKAFKKLFKGQWKKTKKRIRKEFFWTKKNEK